jgi:hypothetical protein
LHEEEESFKPNSKEKLESRKWEIYQALTLALWEPLSKENDGPTLQIEGLVGRR